MEDLSKHQLILLVLLVTFVTSIATSIISFTLLQEAPVEVTQNISRVVERTIEKVVEVEGEPQKVVTTVVVNEEDRILEAIGKNEKSVVRLKTPGADGSQVVAGMGLVVSGEGIVVADLRSYTSGANYTIFFHDGKSYSASKTFVDQNNGLVFLKTAVPQSESPKYVFHPIAFGNSDGLKIGQTIVALSGRDSNAASIGRVFQLVSGEDEGTVKSIYSDIKVGQSHFGSPILNLSGEIVGLEAPIAVGDTEYSYTPVNLIKSALPQAIEALNK